MARVLIVDDDRAIRHLITQTFSETDIDVEAADSAEHALEMLANQTYDAIVLDIELPGLSGLDACRQIQQIDGKLPVIFITGGGTSDTAIEAMKLGAYDYLLKPLDIAEVKSLVRKAVEIRRLSNVPVQVEEIFSAEDKGDQIVGRSPAMQAVFKAIGRVAPQNVTVLIRGESGTGKELVARAIYQHSERVEGPFLAVNCAAIPEHLLESELFGHEKGAFTGADRTRIGKFEQCNGGTIFLDEVGDMPAPLQSKMLRVLQQQTFQRVGSNETIKTDVRIVAATNRHLEDMVTNGQFREDLLYRLNGYTIELPPLRDRGDDVLLLLQHVLARISREVGKRVDSITPEALERFKSYRWPGNIRELEGALRQSLLQTSGTVITLQCLPTAIGVSANSTNRVAENDREFDQEGESDHNLKAYVEQRLVANSSELYAETLELMERYLLSTVLTLTEGNQSEASRILGITRGSLRHKIRNLGIKIEHVVEANGNAN